MRFALLVAAVLLVPQDDPAKQARDLVEKLRSEAIADRDEATRKLKELGKAAAAELEKAAKDKDADVAARAKTLLFRLELIDTLPAALQKAMAGIADSLAFGGDIAWSRALVEAELKLQPGSRIPVLKRTDLEPLAERAVRGAISTELKHDVGEAVLRRRLAGAMPEILKFFDEADEDLWFTAMEAVRQHPDAKGTQRLRDLTRDEIPERRRLAIDCLMDLDLKDAAPDAARLIADPDPSVRAVAASALARLKGREAAGELVPLLRDEDGSVRKSAVYGLMAIYAREEAGRLVGLLRDSDAEVRRAAAWTLGNLGHREAIPQLMPLLEEEIRNRCAAIGALRMLRATEAVPRALKLLEDVPEESGISILFELLIDLGPGETRERAVQLLNHENSRIRVTALQLLGRVGDAKAHPEILKRLKDDDVYVRYEAAWAAGRLGIREAIPDLLKLLNAKEGPHRSEVIMALASLDAKEAIPGIVACLKDEDKSEDAMWALAALKARDAAKAIAEFLKDKRQSTRMQAMQALVRLEGREAIPRILPLLDDEEFSICEATIEGLAELEAWDLARRVALCLDDRIAEVRAAAAGFLARAGSREGVTALLEDEEDADLWVLNALRRPEVWKRLQRVKVTGKRFGTPLRKIRAMAKEAGMDVEVVAGPWGDGERRLDREWGTSELDRPTPLLDAIWWELPQEYELILESDRIRLIPREEALRFWRAWWKETARMHK